MCGLFGYISKDNNNQEIKTKIISGLAVTMESRGEDSTGIATVKDGQVKITKKAVKATEFVNTIKKEMLTIPEIVIGHTRQATTGVVSDKNAHPFQKGKIVGAHNGIVSNYLTIDSRIEVDSEVIFDLLNKNNNDFEKTFKKLSGSFAITWFNEDEPNKVFLVASGNPLSLISVPELKTVFWASESLPLKAIIETTVGLGKKQVWSPKENTVYIIDTNLTIQRHKVRFKKDNFYRQFYWGSINPNIYNYQNEYYQDETLNPFWSQDPEVANEIVSLVEYGVCEICGKPIVWKDGFYFNEFQWTVQCPECRRLSDPYNEDEEYCYIDKEDYQEILVSVK